MATFRDIESQARANALNFVQEVLHDKTYDAGAVEAWSNSIAD